MPQGIDHVRIPPTLVSVTEVSVDADLQAQIAELREDIDSMDRCFARSIVKVALAEDARDDARIECDALLQQLRGLRGSLEWAPTVSWPETFAVELGPIIGSGRWK